MEVTIEPATRGAVGRRAERFGTRGDPSRCWCVYLLRPKVDYRAPAPGGEPGRAARACVAGGREPGLLAYSAGGPVGWVSAAPRELFADAAGAVSGAEAGAVRAGEVWSVLCFVVPRPLRGQGVAHALLAGAVEHARGRGAVAIDGVPRDDTGGRRWADPVAYTGTASMFAAAGFVPIERRRDDRVVYRLVL